MRGHTQDVRGNEQDGNKCDECGNKMIGDPFKFCPICDDYDDLW